MYELIWDFRIAENKLAPKDTTKVRTKDLTGTAFDGYSEAQLYSEFVNDYKQRPKNLFPNVDFYGGLLLSEHSQLYMIMQLM